jgi:hypothetical protein
VPEIEDVIDERLDRMSPLIHWFSVTFSIGGLFLGVALTGGLTWMIPAFLGVVGFVVGVVIGVTLDVVLLKPRRDRLLRERRRLRRRQAKERAES